MRIEEIFVSLQGETPFAGIPFVFVRLSGCNLRCQYCDTPAALHESPLCRLHFPDGETTLPNPIPLESLRPFLQPFAGYWLSFTGGEPLLQAKEIETFMTLFPHFRFWMETNGTLSHHISSFLLENIEVWSMDIKLPSATTKNLWESHQHFFSSLLKAKTIILKVVLTPTTPIEEMETLWQIFQEWKAQRPDITLVFQPMTHNTHVLTGKAFFWAYEKVLATPDGSLRILPQIHPLLHIP
ncbi:MAG: 7-carboxy-7-deazaguanine synthase QueE [Brevinematales bacterium]|nr:7-carboxy-7-deazaguanine synthase QueE [Brevinematales bacterium]